MPNPVFNPDLSVYEFARLEFFEQRQHLGLALAGWMYNLAVPSATVFMAKIQRAARQQALDPSEILVQAAKDARDAKELLS